MTLRKKDFRCKAHAGIFKTNNLDIQISPNHIDWSKYFKNGNPPTYLDIGCGYGRYLFKAGSECPYKNILGVEIREKVFNYVKQYIEMKEYTNIGVINTNALLFLCNIITPHSIEKMFILFPDPHFKKSKQKGRMVCRQQMAMFKYLLVEKGEVYISTDVAELFEFMCEVFDDSGLFRIKKDGNFNKKTDIENDIIDDFETDIINNQKTDKIDIENDIIDNPQNRQVKNNNFDFKTEDYLFKMCYTDTDEAHRAGNKTGITFGRIYELK